MDQEQLSQQIQAHKQTTKQLGCMLMCLLLVFLGLAGAGGFFIYKHYQGQQQLADGSGGTPEPTVAPTEPATDPGVGLGDDDDDDDDDDDGLSPAMGNDDDDDDTGPAVSPAGDDDDDDDDDFGDLTDTPPTPPTPSPPPVTQAPPSRTIPFTIATKPKGAKVFLGTTGKYLGKTPLTVELSVGEQRLTFVLSGHKKVRQKVLVGKQKKTWAVLPSTRPKPTRRATRPAATKPSQRPVPRIPSGVTPPPGMVYVPGGYFLRGAGSGPEDARPKTKIKLSPFFIDAKEVTVSEYNRFLIAMRVEKQRFRDDEGDKQDYKYRAPYGSLPQDYFTNPDYQNHPVVNVDWFDAYAYCRWKGKRLPTEAEWERASRGLRSSAFPWGMRAKGDEANWKGPGDKSPITAAVGQFRKDRSDFGCVDMAGNVREWVYDWYGKDYYAKSPKSNPKGPTTGTFRVIKGSSWNDEPKKPLFHRGYSPRRGKFTDVGFRCAIYAK